MGSKTKTYLIIGAVILVVVLIVVAISVHFRGGDPTVVTTAASVVAATAAATAATRREEASKKVTEARKEGEALAAEVKNQASNTAEKMAVVDAEVAASSRDEKEREAEKLLGG